MAKELSGQVTVTTAGVAVQGPSTPTGRVFALKAHPDNNGIIWFGNDGNDDVTGSNGFPLEAGEGCIIDMRALFFGDSDVAFKSLEELWFDASKNAQKVCWHRLA